MFEQSQDQESIDQAVDEVDSSLASFDGADEQDSDKQIEEEAA
jgi:hypothetical protein